MKKIMELLKLRSKSKCARAQRWSLSQRRSKVLLPYSIQEPIQKACHRVLSRLSDLLVRGTMNKQQ